MTDPDDVGVVEGAAGAEQTIRNTLLLAGVRQPWKALKALDALVADREALLAENSRLTHIMECADTPLMADVMGDREAALARVGVLEGALRRAAFVAEHLWQMVDRETWRDSGAFVEGIYEGEVRADQVRQEIESWAVLAGGEAAAGIREACSVQTGATIDFVADVRGTDSGGDVVACEGDEQ